LPVLLRISRLETGDDSYLEIRILIAKKFATVLQSSFIYGKYCKTRFAAGSCAVLLHEKLVEIFSHIFQDRTNEASVFLTGFYFLGSSCGIVVIVECAGRVRKER
jgi:hypothetical protein